VVGGAGAIVALTVAYRRQKDIEDGRFTERFGAAAGQLGADTPAERLGGVYAMAGVADRYPAFAQQCIAVLCGYLRLPFDPDPAKTHLTQIVKHTIATGADSEPANTEDQTYQLLPNDREVRDSIVRVIAEHVRAHHETGWHENHFDLKGATLTTSDFSHSHFQGTFDCTGAKFTGRAVFDETQFNGAVFDDTTFNDLARFESSTFNRNATFKRATFNSGAWFFNATFNSDDVKRFEGAQFNSLALFNEAKLVANLRTATFNDLRATFRGLVVLPDGTRKEPVTEEPQNPPARHHQTRPPWPLRGTLHRAIQRAPTARHRPHRVGPPGHRHLHRSRPDVLPDTWLGRCN